MLKAEISIDRLGCVRQRIDLLSAQHNRAGATVLPGGPGKHHRWFPDFALWRLEEFL